MNFRIGYYDQLDSTNDLARSLAIQGATEGLVIVTDFQKKGRGQFDRKWVSPRAKNLLFSILLRPDMKASEASILTILAARAMVEMLKTNYGLPATIKKPNDVLVGKRKIAGILTESAARASQMEYVVLGVGLNVNATRSQLPKIATSMMIEKRETFDRNTILNQYLSYFSKYYKEITLKKGLELQTCD